MNSELRAVVEELDVLLRGPPPVVGVMEQQWLEAVREKAAQLQAAAPEKAEDIQYALTEFILDPYTGRARLRDIIEEIKPSVEVQPTPEFQEKVVWGPLTITPTAESVEFTKRLIYALAGAAALAVVYWAITRVKEAI